MFKQDVPPKTIVKMPKAARAPDAKSPTKTSMFTSLIPLHFDYLHYQSLLVYTDI